MRKRNKPWDDRPEHEVELAKWRQKDKWRQKERTHIEARIELVRRCQTTPRTVVGSLRRTQTIRGRRARLVKHWHVERDMPTRACVYMLWCPTLSLYKIGHTSDLKMRMEKHRRKLDWHVTFRAAFYTPVRRALERFLHRHFRPYHRASLHGNELFDLSQTVAEGFAATAEAIERHLLAIELLRLEARLLMVDEAKD